MNVYQKGVVPLFYLTHVFIFYIRVKMVILLRMTKGVFNDEKKINNFFPIGFHIPWRLPGRRSALYEEK